MKASELIAELQRGIGEHGDWEVVHPETQCPANVVWWVMPSLSDREDYDAKPHVVITRDANRDLP